MSITIEGPNGTNVVTSIMIPPSKMSDREMGLAIAPHLGWGKDVIADACPECGNPEYWFEHDQWMCTKCGEGPLEMPWDNNPGAIVAWMMSTFGRYAMDQETVRIWKNDCAFIKHHGGTPEELARAIVELFLEVNIENAPQNGGSDGSA